MTDINEFKMKKISRKLNELGESTKEGGYAFAEACFALAYKARGIDSQMKANQRNNDKHN